MPTDPSMPTNWLKHDRFRFFIFLEIAAAGFLVAFTLAHQLGFGSNEDDPNIAPMVVAALAGAGGIVPGLLLSGWFGRPGRDGWVVALIAAVLSPAMAGAIVGTFLAPLDGTVVGAVLALSLFMHAKSFAVWLGCFLVIHLHLRFLRQRVFQERRLAPDVFE